MLTNQRQRAQAGRHPLTWRTRRHVTALLSQLRVQGTRYVGKYLKHCWYSINDTVSETVSVCTVCLPVNRQDESAWVILSQSQDNRKKGFSDRWSTGAQEWEKVEMGETQSFPRWLGESVRFLRVLNWEVLPKHGTGRLSGAACGFPVGRRDSRWGSGGPLIHSDSTRGSEADG